MRIPLSKLANLGATAIFGACLGACGLKVASPDLFLLTRQGQGKPLMLLVSDDGTIRCNGGPSRLLPDAMLLQARTLATELGKDARAKLSIPSAPNSVFSYTIKLKDGTVRFPDTAASQHHELSEVELFAVQAARGPCGSPGSR